MDRAIVGSGTDASDMRPPGGWNRFHSMYPCFILAVTYNSDEDAASWVRALHRRGGSIKTDATGCQHSHSPAAAAAASDSQDQASTQDQPPQPELPELIYSKGSFQQEQHSCPFDFSQPVPADAEGRPRSYAECLAQHGKSLDEGYDLR